MQHTLNQMLLGPARRATSQDHPSLNVVIAYEDFETGKQAKRTCDILAENLRCECQFTSQMWKFGVLAHPKLREMAVLDAVQADILIIASRGGAELPAEVQGWLKQWRAASRRAIALVALFNCDAREAQCIRKYLAGVAEQAETRFFAQPQADRDSGRAKEPSEFSEAAPSRRNADLNNRALSSLAGAMQRDLSFPRWGINE